MEGVGVERIGDPVGLLQDQVLGLGVLLQVEWRTGVSTGPVKVPLPPISREEEGLREEGQFLVLPQNQLALRSGLTPWYNCLGDFQGLQGLQLS